MVAFAQRKVLVLNKPYQPIAVISLEKAMALVVGTFEGTNEPKARILTPGDHWQQWTWQQWSELKAAQGEPVIRSAKAEFRVPEIIVLSRYSGFPQQKVKFSRRTIYRRDNYQCQYCGIKPGSSELSVDHVHPRSHGGQTTWENCVIACTKCNRKKGNRTMAQANMKFFNPKYKPHKPKFTLYKGDYRCESWEAVLGEMYWNVELQNDNA